MQHLRKVSPRRGAWEERKWVLSEGALQIGFLLVSFLVFLFGCPKPGSSKRNLRSKTKQMEVPKPPLSMQVFGDALGPSFPIKSFSLGVSPVKRYGGSPEHDFSLGESRGKILNTTTTSHSAASSRCEGSEGTVRVA